MSECKKIYKIIVNVKMYKEKKKKRKKRRYIIAIVNYRDNGDW